MLISAAQLRATNVALLLLASPASTAKVLRSLNSHLTSEVRASVCRRTPQVGASGRLAETLMHLVISIQQIHSKRGRLFTRVSSVPDQPRSATFVTSTTPLISMADAVNEEREKVVGVRPTSAPNIRQSNGLTRLYREHIAAAVSTSHTSQRKVDAAPDACGCSIRGRSMMTATRSMCTTLW